MNARRPASSQPALTRRSALRALASLGITGPLALELLAQSRGKISIDVLKQASAVLGEEFPAARLEVTEKALQRNLDQFQIVRDLVIGDEVEPAPIFNTKQPGIVGPRTRAKS
jgi:hypothetical protein